MYISLESHEVDFWSGQMVSCGGFKAGSGNTSFHSHRLICKAIWQKKKKKPGSIYVKISLVKHQICEILQIPALRGRSITDIMNFLNLQSKF